MRYFTPCLLSGSILPFVVGCAQSSKQEDVRQQTGKPNVIYLIADDLGIGDLSCYGATRISTPNLDSLAAQGLQFANAYATSSTSTPSRFGLLTGMYPWRQTNTGIAPGNSELIIDTACVTMADMFKAEGYATGIIDVAPVHFPFVDKANILGNPENIDRIFATEVIFGLTNVNRNLMFQNNNDPDHSPQPVLRMDPVLLEAPYFGGGSQYGGSTDDYRYIANWQKSGNDYYFYKYADMADVSRIENTIVPMVRLGEMYIIVAGLHRDDRPLMASWVNKLREHRGVEKMEESQDFRASYLDYEAVRELYGEGQLFYYYKQDNAAIMTAFENAQYKEASEKLYVVPLPDTETENRQ